MSEPNVRPAVAEDRMIVVSPGRPKYPVRAQAAFGITAGDWRALVDAVYPNAKTTEAIELALTYCRARKLDPFKKQCHIVPIWDSKKGAEVETIWPGISELRTTAARTNQLAGCDEAAFGPDETVAFKGTVGKGQYAKDVEKSVTFPTWCQLTVYRLVQGQRVPFPGPKVRWRETYATMGASDVPNEMWATRPYGQLEKCAEAAALRRAFPEEIGSDYIPEEVGKVKDISPQTADPGTGGVRGLEQRLLAPSQRAEAENDARVVDFTPIQAEVVDAGGNGEETATQTTKAPARLTPDSIAKLKGLASSLDLSWDEKVVAAIGPPEEYTLAGVSEGDLYIAVSGKIREMAGNGGKGKKGDGGLFQNR